MEAQRFEVPVWIFEGDLRVLEYQRGVAVDLTYLTYLIVVDPMDLDEAVAKGIVVYHASRAIRSPRL